jgi:hypothetical protein
MLFSLEAKRQRRERLGRQQAIQSKLFLSQKEIRKTMSERFTKQEESK